MEVENISMPRASSVGFSEKRSPLSHLENANHATKDTDRPPRALSRSTSMTSSLENINGLQNNSDSEKFSSVMARRRSLLENSSKRRFLDFIDFSSTPGFPGKEKFHENSLIGSDVLLHAKKDDIQLFNAKSEELLGLLAKGKELTEEVRSFNHRFGLSYPSNAAFSGLCIFCSSILPPYSGSDNQCTNQSTSPTPPVDDKQIQYQLQTLLSEQCIHLEKLYARVSDKSCTKILITGDLNAGKSTLTNALLRRPLLPVDQQPCTGSLCEVHTLASLRHIPRPFSSQLKDIVHLVHDPENYHPCDADSYESFSLAALPDLVTSESPTTLKIYIDPETSVMKMNSTSVTEAPSSPLSLSPTIPSSTTTFFSSLPSSAMHLMQSNGAVDVVLIDSPGLNKDWQQRMLVHAQQDDIDMVVFVVHAENRLTLSGREFLARVEKEKSHVFVVVNRFDTIRDGHRCQMEFLKELAECLPRTHEEAQRYVHFVSAKEALRKYSRGELPSSTFSRMEAQLCHLALERRLVSKLAPAKLFLTNLLHDLSILLTTTHVFCCQHLDDILHILAARKSSYERIRSHKNSFLTHLEDEIDSRMLTMSDQVNDRLKRFVSDLTIPRELEVPSSFLMRCQVMLPKTAWDSRQLLCSFIHREAVQIYSHIQHVMYDHMMVITHHMKEALPDIYDGPFPVDLLKSSPKPLDFDTVSGSEEQLPFSVLKANDIDLRWMDKMDFVHFSGVLSISVGLLSFGASVYVFCSPRGNFAARQWLVTGTDLAVVGMAGIGLGALTCASSDPVITVQRKVLRKVKRHLRATQYMEHHGQSIVQQAKHALRGIFQYAAGKFYATLQSLEIEESEHLRNKQYWIDKREAVALLQSQVHGLAALVDQVHLQE